VTVQTGYIYVHACLCMYVVCGHKQWEKPCKPGLCVHVCIGGDTHTAGAAIAVPLLILGQQPIQNAATTPTMFIIVALAPLNK